MAPKWGKTNAYLNKHSAIRVGVWIDGACCALATNVACEGHAHPTPWGFGEERPGESGHPLHTRIRVRTSRDGWAFHTRTGCPPSHVRRTKYQPHRSILQTKITFLLHNRKIRFSIRRKRGKSNKDHAWERVRFLMMGTRAESEEPELRSFSLLLLTLSSVE